MFLFTQKPQSNLKELDTKVHSSNQQQSIDKHTEQPEMGCGITVSTVTNSDIETVETAPVQVEPETENSDDCDVIIATSDFDTKSVPAADLTKPSFKA